jgi:hypothetical protein
LPFLSSGPYLAKYPTQPNNWLLNANIVIRTNLSFLGLVPKPATSGARVVEVKMTANVVIRTDLSFSGLVPKSATSGARVAKLKMMANFVIRTDLAFP